MKSIVNNVVIATTNKNKFIEFSNIISPITSVALPSNLESPLENGTTFIENAIIKAKFYSKILNKPVISDDSGLVIPALGGLPGVNSSCFAGSNCSSAENIEKLLSMLDSNIDNYCAFFYCVIVFMDHYHDPAPLIGSGKIDGVILKKPRGSSGFGYDSIFFIPSINKTFAELTLVQKNMISHRKLAWLNLKNNWRI